MEITRKEIFLSVLILGIMVGIGVWISPSILRSSFERYLDKVSCVSITDSSRFDYIRKTNAGRFVAEGTLSAIDTVRLPELSRPYSFVHKVKEEYRSHTETYVTSDGKGHTTTHIRTYHSWDEVERWDYAADSVKFLGQRFKAKNVFSYRYHSKRDTIIKVNTEWYERKTRFVYYTCPVSYEGIMTGVAESKNYNDVTFKNDKTIQWYFENAETELQTGIILFWVLWIVLTAAVICGFYALENQWLY